ncbi:MAG: hypothetical protein QOE35_3538 [Actinomycetota bacterium]
MNFIDKGCSTSQCEAGHRRNAEIFAAHFNASSANVLDLTNPEVAGAWGYSGGPITADTIGIGTKASEAGFAAIRF